MKIIKIIPLIVLVFLAACKSTVPHSESLLEESVSPAQENSSSSAEMYLNSSTEDKVVKIENITDYIRDSIFIKNDEVEDPCDCPPRHSMECNAQYNDKEIQLNIRNNKKSILIKVLKEETAIFHEEIHGVTDDVLTEMCSSYKSDSVKKNVNCSGNAINYTIYYEYNGNDYSRDIVLTILDDCSFAGALVHYQCNYNAVKACKERMNADYGDLE